MFGEVLCSWNPWSRFGCKSSSSNPINRHFLSAIILTFPILRYLVSTPYTGGGGGGGREGAEPTLPSDLINPLLERLTILQAIRGIPESFK